LPALALLTVILLLPLGNILIRSLTDPTLTLDNYGALFSDGVTVTVLIRTATTAAMVTAVCFILGYPYAYLMTRVGPTARTILLIIVLMPYCTSVMARNFAWIVILARGGPVYSAFSFFGLTDISFTGNEHGVTIAMSQEML